MELKPQLNAFMARVIKRVVIKSFLKKEPNLIPIQFFICTIHFIDIFYREHKFEEKDNYTSWTFVNLQLENMCVVAKLAKV